MIADLKPYPEYKKSGLAWLGHVPRHWSVSRIKTVLRETDRRSVDGSGVLLSLTRARGLIRHRDMTDKIHSARTLVRYKLYCSGQLVMNRMQAWSGMFGAGPFDGLVSPDYAVFDVLGGHEITFVLERLKTPDLVGQFALESKGIGSGFNRLYTDRFGPIPISLPPLAEQPAIVRFLDWANGRLERAIRAKRRIVALLNEQKLAIIQRAVTRGLDPSVPLTPTGIPWLGDIPRRWELTKLKHLSPHITVGIVIQPARLYVQRGVPALRSLNISSGTISTDDMVFISTEGHLANRKSHLREGDVVVVRTGRTGIAAVIPRAFDGSNCIDLLIIRKAPRLLSEYLLLYLRSYAATADIAFNSVGAIQAHYNTATLANLRIPLPSVIEQKQILEACRSQFAPVDNALSRLEREVELLREYRTRLGADLVTGKLDVRSAAAALPQEPEADFAPSAGIDDEEITADQKLELVDGLDDE